MVDSVKSDPNQRVKYGNNYLNKVMSNKIHIPLTGFVHPNDEKTSISLIFKNTMRF